MTDISATDIVIIIDGENLIMKQRHPAGQSPVRVRLALMDTAGDQIKTLVPQDADDAENTAFLDNSKLFLENYFSSGGLEADREIIRLKDEAAQRTGS